MTDLEFLGIAADYTAADLKKAYRKKSKKLHPDVNSDSINSHFAMIQLNKAYARLLSRLEAPSNASVVIPGQAANVQTAKTDQSYDMYKQGIRFFRNVHPSRWRTISNKNDLFNPAVIETSKNADRIIKGLMNDLSMAYYYFSKLVNEYPACSWIDDAQNKMHEIEKMTVRYARILKSYSKGGIIYEK